MWQSCLVSIPKWYDLKFTSVRPAAKHIGISIPKWYDLKCPLNSSAHSAKACFNSKMVRFKVLFLVDGRLFTTSFNSKMVRFKEGCTGAKLISYLVSIPKWYDLKAVIWDDLIDETKFQFQNGTI